LRERDLSGHLAVRRNRTCAGKGKGPVPLYSKETHILGLGLQGEKERLRRRKGKGRREELKRFLRRGKERRGGCPAKEGLTVGKDWDHGKKVLKRSEKKRGQKG